MAHISARTGKQVAIAVETGDPGPENNPHPYAVVATTRHENMPEDDVKHAIKNAIDKDQKGYREMNYESYSPSGITIFVGTIINNTTHTMANVRSIFNKFDGTLGTSGNLGSIFSWKSMLAITKRKGVDMDDLVLELIDYEVGEEYDEGGGKITLHGDPKLPAQIQKYLEENSLEMKGAELTRIPNNKEDLTPERRTTIDKIVEHLEEDKDVQNVHTNMKPAEDEGGE